MDHDYVPTDAMWSDMSVKVEITLRSYGQLSWYLAETLAAGTGSKGLDACMDLPSVLSTTSPHDHL
ncbi:hypothetical protein CALCODRAFT_494762 [Calocera cornea HHB12733]|uniref:Uncharacterized protein n=1 Tax=Calocera cornea HHB12733 TaxID=1353952 RepID=A0A165GUQ4_9BASI|nr:hypothetical protein CALCODRAFT_494762 [Calocera cornea HHB12733]